ncbi:hypothetical protein JCM13210_08750 [Thermaerobacter litoralis]
MAAATATEPSSTGPLQVPCHRPELGRNLPARAHRPAGMGSAGAGREVTRRRRTLAQPAPEEPAGAGFVPASPGRQRQTGSIRRKGMALAPRGLVQKPMVAMASPSQRPRTGFAVFSAAVHRPRPPHRPWKGRGW